ncbi:histone RNA hairpin-binding protein [Chloropicon primus]|uniref:Histone RNA hairpin-binding protein n=1 Tax=Chloropicon primus TaxID=1764295 RepID=A0A5B8MJW6_9CHLO|nr:histone RNA hairpin-binding protein [Chloropicon primus]UPQ99911.1 histone RNA hairpin-binding protein [Chloropicon primus]|eukprot:QDZ20699.1 histone RNA hairpin-binding protein [Chloropicon primus]
MLRFLERHTRKVDAGGVTSTTRVFALTEHRSKQLGVKRADLEKETDMRRLQQRQKQINIAKQSEAYKKYIQLVPKRRRRKQDPRTPDIHKKCSKRGFDGQVKAWRKQLHSLFANRTNESQKSSGVAAAGPSASRTLESGPQEPEKPVPSNVDYIFQAPLPSDENTTTARTSVEDNDCSLYDGL